MQSRFSRKHDGGPFSAKGDVEGKDVSPESIYGETRLFEEVAEGGGSEGSGCSKAINRGGAAVLTSEAGAAVAKVPQNTGMIGSAKGSLGAWFVGSRTALLQC